MNMRILGTTVAVAIVALLLLLPGPSDPQEQNVVVCYAALDEEFSRPLLEAFQRQTGIKVDMVFDAESTKTIGLVNAIKTEAEGDRPRCDVFWNNEIMNTIRLKNLGVLAPYESPTARPFPPAFRDPQGMWTGFAARARVLIVNTRLVKRDAYPERLADLLRPEWKDRVGIAKPQYGSTATWLTVFFTEHMKTGRPLPTSASTSTPVTQLEIIARLKTRHGLKVLGGNKQTAQAVSSGVLAMAFTDTDDAIVEKENGQPVDILYLDAEADQAGTLFFPNTLSLIRNSPHPQAGRRLIDFLLSAEVETLLAKGASAQIPVNPEVTVKTRTATPKTVKPVQIDWDEVARQFDPAMAWIAKTFGP